MSINITNQQSITLLIGMIYTCEGGVAHRVVRLTRNRSIVSPINIIDSISLSSWGRNLSSWLSTVSQRDIS